MRVISMRHPNFGLRLAVACLLVLVAAASAAMAQPAPAPGTQDDFVPASQLPPGEQMPAAPMVIGAYAFVWVALLVYVWSIWRRVQKVEHEIADLSRRVDAQQE
jgi:CcmD family protein